MAPAAGRLPEAGPASVAHQDSFYASQRLRRL